MLYSRGDIFFVRPSLLHSRRVYSLPSQYNMYIRFCFVFFSLSANIIISTGVFTDVLRYFPSGRLDIPRVYRHRLHDVIRSGCERQTQANSTYILELCAPNPRNPPFFYTQAPITHFLTILLSLFERSIKSKPLFFLSSSLLMAFFEPVPRTCRATCAKIYGF